MPILPPISCSCALYEGAIILAVSWSKSLPITVLASCIVFFGQLYFCFGVFWLLSNSVAFVDWVFSNRQKKNSSTKQFIISFCSSCPPFDLCHQREASNDGESDVPKKMQIWTNSPPAYLPFCLFACHQRQSWKQKLVYELRPDVAGNVLRAMTQGGSRVAC